MKIVLKDFYAVWCPPCQMLKPIIHKLEEEPEFKGKVEFLKIDVDADRKEAEKYGIQSIPTIVVEKDGKLAEKVVGLMPENELRELLRKVMK